MRFFTGVIAAALSSGAVVAAAEGALAEWSPKRNILSFDLLPPLENVRREFRRYGLGENILLVGDSVLGPGHGLPVSQAVPVALRKVEGAAQKHVVPFWRLGLSLAAEYFIADDLAELGEDRVVLEVNLRLLAAACGGCWHYPDLAGHVRPARYPEALRLLLDVMGIIANRLVFYRLVVASGFEPVWASLVQTQARFYNLRDRIEPAFEAQVGLETAEARRRGAYLAAFADLTMTDKPREPREHVLGKVWAAREGVDETYPPLGLLGGIVRRLAEAKKRPLVWIAPVNVDHLRSIGVSVSGFDVSAAAIRSVVERNGGTILDLHDALRDADFVDSFDHPTTKGDAPGSAIIAERIAAVLLAEDAKLDSHAVQ